MDGGVNSSGKKSVQQMRKTIVKIEEPVTTSQQTPVTSSEPSKKNLKNSRAGTFHQNRIRRSTVRSAAAPQPPPEERRYCRYLTKNMLIGIIIMASIVGLIAVAVITVVALNPADNEPRNNSGTETGGA